MNHRAIEIMLVEDNEDDELLIREAIAEASRLNLQHCARDGIAALEYLREQNRIGTSHPVEILIVDINMPRMNGLQLLREIRSDPELACLPVVILTTSKRQDDIQQSYAGGASSYIVKPLGFDEFVEVARTFASYWTSVPELPAH